MGLGLLVKVLGLGKTLLEWIVDAIKGIFKFAIEKPTWFAIILLVGLLYFSNNKIDSLKQELSDSQKLVAEKTTKITELTDSLKSYVVALDKQKEILRTTVETNNKAVDDLKLAADNALKNAQQEALKANAKSKEYKALADKYRAVNPSTGNCEDRIAREEATTDSFIKDIKEAK